MFLFLNKNDNILNNEAQKNNGKVKNDYNNLRITYSTTTFGNNYCLEFNLKKL